MNNLQKRILTSIVLIPLSMFFIIKGGNYIVSFLFSILILANFEAFSVFKRKLSIIFLDSILVLSLHEQHFPHAVAFVMLCQCVFFPFPSHAPIAFSAVKKI